MTLASFVPPCSGAFGKPVQRRLVVPGSKRWGGSLVLAENLAKSLQVALDAGARRIPFPMASVTDIPTIPGELFTGFRTGFYADPTEAVFKALRVE